jgi:hypothetical protein
MFSFLFVSVLNQLHPISIYIVYISVLLVVFLRMFWNFISSLPVKRRGSLSFFDDFHFCRSRVIGLDMTVNRILIHKLVLLWAQLTKIYPLLPTSVRPISITKILLIVPTKNERDSPLFTGKLLIKFQNILRNTPVKRRGSLSFLTIFTFAVPKLLDLIWRKILFLPYVVW